MVCVSLVALIWRVAYRKYPKMANDRYHHLVILLTYLPLHHNLQDPHTEDS